MLLPVVAQDIVERLAEEEEISQSRVVSDLVVEALKARGLWVSALHHANQKKAAARSGAPEELGLDIQTIAPKPKPEPEPEQPSATVSDDDLRLLKKLKLLKELGLL